MTLSGGRPVIMSDFRPTEPLSTGIASGRYGGKPGIADGPLWVEPSRSGASAGRSANGATPS